MIGVSKLDNLAKGHVGSLTIQAVVLLCLCKRSMVKVSVTAKSRPSLSGIVASCLKLQQWRTDMKSKKENET